MGIEFKITATYPDLPTDDVFSKKTNLVKQGDVPLPMIENAPIDTTAFLGQFPAGVLLNWEYRVYDEAGNPSEPRTGSFTVQDVVPPAMPNALGFASEQVFVPDAPPVEPPAETAHQ